MPFLQPKNDHVIELLALSDVTVQQMDPGPDRRIRLSGESNAGDQLAERHRREVLLQKFYCFEEFVDEFGLVVLNGQKAQVPELGKALRSVAGSSNCVFGMILEETNDRWAMGRVVPYFGDQSGSGDGEIKRFSSVASTGDNTDGCVSVVRQPVSSLIDDVLRFRRRIRKPPDRNTSVRSPNHFARWDNLVAAQRLPKFADDSKYPRRTSERLRQNDLLRRATLDLCVHVVRHRASKSVDPLRTVACENGSPSSKGSCEIELRRAEVLQFVYQDEGKAPSIREPYFIVLKDQPTKPDGIVEVNSVAGAQH